MDDQFKKEVIIRLDAIDANLEVHMKRSDALEAQVEPLKKMSHEFLGAVHLIKLLAALAAIAELIHLLRS
jgi:hypothetical protein